MYQIHQEVFDLLMSHHNKDENFLFTFRKINRDKKLDKGYWFLGNDDYLAVSFWTGKDWLAKTPRIYFEINKNGTSSLEFRNHDVSSKYDFFNINLLEEVGANKSYYGFSKKFNNENYLEALESFLLKDKLIIDKHIRSHDNSYSASEYADPMDFLFPGDFKKQLERIKFYQDKLSKKIEPIADNGFLRSIDIRNFGPIIKVSIKKLSPENTWIFLTGENGSGKTSILKAIAVALCKNNDKGEIIATKKEYGKFKIVFDFHNGKYRSLQHKVGSSVKDIDLEKVLVDGFATYGPLRLLSEGALDLELFNNSSNIQEKMTYGLFHPISILKDLTKEYALNEQPRYYELTKDSMVGNLEYILPNIARVEEGKDGKLFFYELDKELGIDEKGTTFENLPSGTRNFAALILDLLIRLQHQQPEINDISNYKGIVLIDEIDIHLHPKLQIELVNQLSGTFPNIQFIVSTHSPIPILGAPLNSVFLRVERNKKRGTFITRLKDIEENFQHLLPNALLTSDLFDLEKITHKAVETENVNTSDSFEEYQLDIELDKQLNILKTNDDETFNDFIK